MTHAEFRALALDEPSGLLAIHLKEGSAPIQPVRLRNPLPTKGQSVLYYTQIGVETKTIRLFIDIKLIMGERMQHFSYVKLADIESIEVLPYVVRNSKASTR